MEKKKIGCWLEPPFKSGFCKIKGKKKTFCFSKIQQKSTQFFRKTVKNALNRDHNSETAPTKLPWKGPQFGRVWFLLYFIQMALSILAIYLLLLTMDIGSIA